MRDLMVMACTNIRTTAAEMTGQAPGGKEQYIPA
jgi:hypothetical protein